jgi:hypothetical protein
MITSKHVLCSRFVWRYITMHPHALAREIASATATYNAAEVMAALMELEEQGYIELDVSQPGRGWVAAVPFVVQP